MRITNHHQNLSSIQVVQAKRSVPGNTPVRHDVAADSRQGLQQKLPGHVSAEELNSIHQMMGANPLGNINDASMPGGDGTSEKGHFESWRIMESLSERQTGS